MEGLRIATPPKYGVEKEKKVRPRVAIPKFGVTSLLSNPVGYVGQRTHPTSANPQAAFFSP